MTVTPCDGRVLLSELSGEERKKLTFGSTLLVMPSSIKAEYVPARVDAIGECQTIPGGIKYTPKFKVGDVVLYAKSMASDVTLYGKNLILVDYAYVGGVVSCE